MVASVLGEPRLTYPTVVERLLWLYSHAMARLLLIRHAPTPETGTRLTGRLPGVSLGPDGIAAAERTAECLSGTTLKRLYASPIERTMETAAIVGAPHGLAPIVEEGVVEIDFGTWAGRSFGQLRRTKLWSTVQSVPSQARFPDGESFLEAQHRAVAACNRIATEAGKATVAVVSHSDVIKLVVSHYLGQPIDLFQRINISTTSVSVIHLSPGSAPFVDVVNGQGVLRA
jgi:broad specificity phosphatase PhoE